MEFTINVQATGNFDKEDLKRYLLFCIGVGNCPAENPFINEDCDAEIIDVDID